MSEKTFNNQPLSVLCVDSNEAARHEVVRTLHAAGIRCDHAATIAEAHKALPNNEYDVLLVDMASNQDTAFDFAEQRAHSGEPTRVIMTASQLDPKTTLEAMRRGAIDIIVKPYVVSELLERVRSAASQAIAIRHQARRVTRLKRICKRLTAERDEAQKNALLPIESPNDDAPDFRTLSGQLSTFTMASEFGSAIRSELDIENVLRMLLEHLLRKIGPTNAAVFLPTGQEDYALGAYINYDVERENADMVLDHLADIVPARFEHTDELTFLKPNELSEHLGDDASWVAGSQVIVFPVHSQERCMAVVLLFRDEREPFTESMLPELEILRDVFAEQLARVVRVHNRADPADAPWSGFFVDDTEEDTDWQGGMAA
ncbi:MAG: response regulator [Planctomycetota bacterium]